MSDRVLKHDLDNKVTDNCVSVKMKTWCQEFSITVNDSFYLNQNRSNLIWRKDRDMTMLSLPVTFQISKFVRKRKVNWPNLVVVGIMDQLLASLVYNLLVSHTA